ncbi:hypothetical protein WG906_14335 [Pedobacter sp. P351]|uniref:hypothetical protein n=1 Tax=Pedobacter superstes TaxID=3133441 RepID=UPI00309A2885
MLRINIPACAGMTRVGIGRIVIADRSAIVMHHICKLLSCRIKIPACAGMMGVGIGRIVIADRSAILMHHTFNLLSCSALRFLPAQE